MTGQMVRNSKTVAFATSLMVLFALVVPLIAPAGATHTGGTTSQVTHLTLAPQSDSAVTGDCNEYTVSASENENGTIRGAEGESVDITVSQADSDTLRDLQISFCDPDAGGPATNLGQTDCDDNVTAIGSGVPLQNDGACTLPPTGANQEASARINGQCTTVLVSNEAAECRFGVTSNEAGTMNLLAYIDANNSDTFGTGDTVSSNQATKTWTAGTAEAGSIVCDPTTDSNPEGSTHVFRCQVKNAQGQTLANQTVNFDVTAGPNADEQGPQTCGPTDATGFTATTGTTPNYGAAGPGSCDYTDAGGALSPPGKDTITAWVNLTAAGSTAGPDAGEPTVTIEKTWFGNLRSVDCEPETATNPPNTNHTITCTTRDAGGNTVAGGQITFTESGPGRIVSQSNTAGPGGSCVSNAAGICEVVVTTSIGETGEQTVTGSITNSGAPGPTNECAFAANNPTTGNPAGVCTDSVLKTWATPTTTTTTAPPPPPACPLGVNPNPQGNCVFSTQITVRYDKQAHKIKGVVTSDYRRCSRGRNVTAKQRGKGQIGSDSTDRYGRYSIRWNAPRRARLTTTAARTSFTARNGATIVCQKAVSVPVQIRHKGKKHHR